MDNPQGLSSEWIAQFFQRLTPIPTEPFAVWTGGEPFLSIDALKTGINRCSEIGFHSEILTSGIWFNPYNTYLEELKKEGDFSLRISLDAEHQRSVSRERIKQLVNKATSLKIPVSFTLRHIPSHSDSVTAAMSFIRSAFPGLYEQNCFNSRWIHIIPTIDPRRQKQTESKRRQVPAPFSGTCKLGFKDLVVGDDGRIYPCCGVFMLKRRDWLSPGNPLQDSLDDIFLRITSFELFNLLRFVGIHAVIEKLKQPQIQIPSIPPDPLCSLCVHILDRDDAKVAFGRICPSNSDDE